MKTAYIHIGHEKTGTTSLQIFLQKNREALFQHNLVYLGDESCPYVHGIGHFPIVASFYDKCPNFIPPSKHKPVSEVLGALSKDADETDCDIILSCEHFSSRLDKLENIQCIREALPNRQIKIILYLRRQDEQAISLYSTLVKSGHTAPFSLKDVVPENRYYNYSSILKDWVDVFGRENILLREYNNDKLFQQSICTDFLDILNIEPTSFVQIEEQNVSLDSLQVEVLRSINKHLTSYPWGDLNVDLEMFEQSQRIRVALAPYLSSGVHIRSLLTEKERKKLLNEFKETNLEITNLFENSDFIFDWHELKGCVKYPIPPSSLSFSDIEKTLISCGRALDQKNRLISDLSLEREGILQERDDALYELELISQKTKPTLYNAFEALKRWVQSGLFRFG